jgi:triacylglycerol lipase
MKTHHPDQTARLIQQLFIILCFFIPVFSPSAVAQQIEHSKIATSFSQLLEYAALSSAAYQDRQSIEKLLEQRGEILTEHGNIPSYHVSYFLATNMRNKTQLLSIRGTSNVVNALTDIALQQLKDQHTGIPLHQGFALSARDIYAQIRPKLIKDFKLSTTGHSLGGAVAVVLAMYLDTDGYDVDQVFTFGQPKLTNITGALKFKHLKLIRVVTEKDYVPLVPPLDLVDINNINIYWHLGEEVVLLDKLPDKTDYSTTRGLKSMLRATRFLTEKPGEDNLRSHFMSHYTDSIKNKIGKATYTPYINNFNIFGLF